MVFLDTGKRSTKHAQHCGVATRRADRCGVECALEHDTYMQKVCICIKRDGCGMKLGAGREEMRTTTTRDSEVVMEEAYKDL